MVEKKSGGAYPRMSSLTVERKTALTGVTVQRIKNSAAVMRTRNAAMLGMNTAAIASGVPIHENSTAKLTPTCKQYSLFQQC